MAKKDLTERFVSTMLSRRPKKEGGGTFNFAMSDKDIFGDIKYVLLTGNEDYDTFTGGFPFGRISEVFGLENCGKSAMMIRSMCRFQAKHIYEVVDKKGFIYTLKRVDPKRVRLIKAYIDNEGSLEKGFKLGITDSTFDENGKEVVEQTMMEKTGIGLCDTIEQVLMALDEFLQIIREAEQENEDEENGELIFGIFIVDTVAGTSSRAEMKREWNEDDYPRAAGKISEGFRRLRAEISRHNVAAIFTNQVRTNMKQSGSGYRVKFATPQQDDFSTFGGKALEFYSTHRVFMFKVPIKYTLVKGAQFPAGFLIGYRTVKNRLRKPLREGRMVLLFDEQQGGLHNIFSILETMLFLKVAELHESGAISFKFRDYGIETTTFAENVTLTPKEGEKPKRRKRDVDPLIEGRYQWLGFYKAHRTDLEKLRQVAIDRANATEGLDPHYEPDAEDDQGCDSDPEAPRPRREQPRTPIPGIADEDLDGP